MAERKLSDNGVVNAAHLRSKSIPGCKKPGHIAAAALNGRAQMLNGFIPFSLAAEQPSKIIFGLGIVGVDILIAARSCRMASLVWP